MSELGSFIRQQRSVASLSLRRLSELAGISNPYLSQIERGLRTPSAQILQQLARALRISAESIYVQAGILERRPPEDDLEARILADPHLDEAQRQALVRVYRSFRGERGRDPGAERPAAGAGAPGAPGGRPHAGAGPHATGSAATGGSGDG
ncbi:MAG: helix-turn-helix transcriptional regulator [Actinomycetota bacterium]|nr:helix-turn-helix transcriptional regulator [Actinomycetota bacterium]